MAEFTVLGAVELRVGGRVLDCGPPKQRAVLAVLLVAAGEPVPVETIVDRVWGESAPAEARKALYAHVTRIRRTLAEAGPGGGGPGGATDGGGLRLDRRAGGYVLTAGPDDVDLHRFDRLVARAREAGTPPAERLRLLREAVELWRGEPLAGLPGEWAARLRQSLRDRYLDAVLAWARAELEAGDPAVVIAPLRALVDEHPLAEPLTAGLMRALSAVGRHAEALELFAAARGRLVAELGTEPGPELADLHHAILRGQVAHVASPPRAAIVPRQLPPDVAGFAGRAAYLRRLDVLLPAAGDDRPGAVVISAVAGAAGIGKTTLAVHWAHRVADRFPDGQLYVNLRGFDPGGRPVPPGEAVRGFLDALGVPPARIPAGLAGQSALYRSLLAGRRILVVLDNARDAAQVRPLLPASSGCLALVTSRDQLMPLVAADGAHPLTLDVMPVTEARELLARRLGAARVAAEPRAAEAVIDACARLPLALSIAAARGRQTGFSLSGVAAELGAADHPPVPPPGPDQHGYVGDLLDRPGPGDRRLDALDAGDATSQVRAVFSWSYTSLSPPAARLFRLLGLHPGPDLSTAAAASLAALPVAETRRLLAELCRASMLTEHRSGRYTFHDLLRAYAADLAHADDGEAARQAAVDRVLDHYAHSGHAADRVLSPHRSPMPVPLADPHPGCQPERPADRAAARAWLHAERPVLRAALRYAGAAALDTHTWQLAWSLGTLLDRDGHLDEVIDVWATALRAAERLGEPLMEAYCRRYLAHAAAQTGRYAEAHAHLRRVLEVHEAAGDGVGRADAHRRRAFLWSRQGHPDLALAEARRALALYRQTHHQRGEALALNAIGWYHALLGDHGRALAECEKALALLEELDDRQGQASTWDSLGFAHHHLGDHARAVECYQRSLELFRERGDRHEEAATLRQLADALDAAGDTEAARDALRRSLDILTALDHHDVAAVRAQLEHHRPVALNGADVRIPGT